MENNENAVKVLGALLVGTVVGGILGVLFAPDKGSETRRKLTAKSDAVKDKFNELLADAKRQVEDLEANEKMSLNSKVY